MKKFHVLAAALFAVLAFGALVAASASALEFLLAEWLLNGAAVTGELPTLAVGELTLLELAPLIGEVSALCSGDLHGDVMANGEDMTLELLSLTDVAINLTGLVETGLECVNLVNCPTPLVWAVNLPWLTVAELMEDEGSFFVDLILSSGVGNPGWEVQCMGSGTSDTCTSTEAVSELKNTETDVEALFSEAITLLAGLPLASCSLGGQTGVVVSDGPGLITHVEGGTLSVSSTG